jgi:hypothetical protein
LLFNQTNFNHSKAKNTHWLQEIFLPIQVFCIIDQARSFKGGGCLFPCEVRPMGTWNNLQKGFTVNERLPDTLVDVAVCNVYFGVANIHRQKEQIKKPPCVTLASYRVA